MRAAAIVSLSLALVACSGAPSSDLFAPSASQDVTATSPPGSTHEHSAPNGGDGSPSSSSGASGGQADPGPPPAPPPPAPACPPEVEPNDTSEQATPFASSICGALATKSDVDYLVVVAPAKARQMKYVITADGSLATSLTIDGFPVLFDQDGVVPLFGAASPSASPRLMFRLEHGRGDGHARDGHPAYEVDVTFE